MPKLTQNDRVLMYIKEFGSITSMQAMSDLHIACLTRVMTNIRRMGYKVIVVKMKGHNIYGNYTYARYFLDEVK